MSLGTYLIGAVVAFIIVPSCYSAFCDEGPPGAFCLLPNLEGYRKCVYNPKTGKVDESVHECPKNTRCKCMGIPCETSTVCGSYRLPPIWPEDYTLDANDIYKVCSPAGCRTTSSRIAMWRDTKNKKYRQDNTIAPHDPAYEYWIVLPNKESSYDQYHIVPSQNSCTKSQREDFPSNLRDIPRYFQYDGTEVVAGITTNRWIWKQGGRNSGMPINSYIFNTYNGKFLQFRAHAPGSQMSRTSISDKLYAGKFVPGTPNQDMFLLPKHCENAREVESEKLGGDFSDIFRYFEN